MKKRLCLGAAVWALVCPLRVFAAGQDAVNLSQEGSKVAVSLEMSNAAEEKITAVSLSLQVDAEGQAEVGFEFAPGLEDTEHKFIYKADEGRLDIYAASAKSLFDGEMLNLGYVSVTPADAAQLMSVEISYCEDSFQTANGSYGDKTPIVEKGPEPVSMKVGNGAVYPPGPGEGGSDPVPGGDQDSDSKEPDTGTGTLPDDGSQNPGNGSQGGSPGDGGQEGGSGGGNINDGLYDENTQFKNDPSNAQNISSTVIRKDGQTSGLIDMSQGTIVQVTGNPVSGTGGKARAKKGGNVAVVDPGNGPSGILIAKEEGGISGTGKPEGDSGGTEGESLAEMESGTEEILLDQENGGAVDRRKKMKIDSKILLICCAAAAAVVAIAVMVLLLKGSRKGNGQERRKKRRRKKKKHSGHSGKRKNMK